MSDLHRSASEILRALAAGELSPVELMQETWPGVIGTVTIGATRDDGGTRGSVVTVGSGLTNWSP